MRGHGDDGMQSGDWVCSRSTGKWRCAKPECDVPRDENCEHEIAQGLALSDALYGPVEYVSDPEFDRVFGHLTAEDNGPGIGHGEE